MTRIIADIPVSLISILIPSFVRPSAGRIVIAKLNR